MCRTTSPRPQKDSDGDSKDYRDFLVPEFAAATADGIEPALRAQLRKAIEDGGPFPILIHGQPGNGKSSAAAIALASHQLRAHKAGHRHPKTTGFFWVWETVLRDILSARKRKDRSFLQNPGPNEFWRREAFIWERIKDPSMLVVFDDFGVQVPAEWERGVMFELVNATIGTNTIFTSNNSIEQMQAKGMICGRIASRLNGGTVIANTGDDRRKGKRVAV